MKVQCGWCKRAVADKEPFGDDRISHGICSECFKDQMGETGMTVEQERDELLAMVRELIAINPAFRVKNIGYEGSHARLQQAAQIAAEDKAIALIARIEKESQS